MGGQFRGDILSIFFIAIVATSLAIGLAIVLSIFHNRK